MSCIKFFFFFYDQPDDDDEYPDSVVMEFCSQPLAFPNAVPSLHIVSIYNPFSIKVSVDSTLTIKQGGKRCR